MLHVVLVPAADFTAAFALPLRGGQYVVGRGALCDIVILDPSVSRRHAHLCVKDSSISITDLGSRNGTFVDDLAVATSAVRTGQVIRFGAMPYRLTIEDEASLSSQCDDEETGSRSDSGTENGTTPLTPAQHRVYELLLDGTPEAAIAEKLGLSVHTVHTHVKAIYSQLCVHSRAELCARHLRSRLTHPRPPG